MLSRDEEEEEEETEEKEDREDQSVNFREALLVLSLSLSLIKVTTDGLHSLKRNETKKKKGKKSSSFTPHKKKIN